MQANVAKAVEGIRGAFPGAIVVVEEDNTGGAKVRVEGIQLSAAYVQESTWIAADIPAQVPYVDIYPLFVRGDLTRRDGAALGGGLSPGHNFMGKDAVQASRRSPRRDAGIETPALKFLKVMAYLNQL